MGSALHVPLPSGLKSGSGVKVAISYATTKDCIALQWLDKEYAISGDLDESESYTGKLKEKPFPISSVSVNPYMHALSRPCKVIVHQSRSQVV